MSKKNFTLFWIFVKENTDAETKNQIPFSGGGYFGLYACGNFNHSEFKKFHDAGRTSFFRFDNRLFI